MDPRLEKVSVNDLRPGMYVERLDCAWTETPFLFQGFFIHDHDEIEVLQRYCRFVFVDPMRGNGAAEKQPAEQDRTITRISSRRPPDERPRPSRSRESYAVQQPVEREIEAAKLVHADATQAAKTILDHLRRGGSLDVTEVKQVVEPMLGSMLRNPDALIWLTRMKRHDNYIYRHSVNASIWGIAFARHLGLDRPSIMEIGLGCLLFDVGKTRLPPALLAKPGPLTEIERRVAESHVEFSLEILGQTEGVGSRIMNMVASHHERHDGSGYPAGQKGNEIPTFAKIAGMVDCYDALVNERPYAPQRTPHEAIREIYGWRGNLFQPEVVEQFMQVVGVFPTGSLVELNTGEVGVVISQNESRRLRPRLMLVLDGARQRLAQFKIVDLLHDLPWNDSTQYWVEKHVDPAACGLDPQELYLSL